MYIPKMLGGILPRIFHHPKWRRWKLYLTLPKIYIAPARRPGPKSKLIFQPLWPRQKIFFFSGGSRCFRVRNSSSRAFLPPISTSAVPFLRDLSCPGGSLSSRFAGNSYWQQKMRKRSMQIYASQNKQVSIGLLWKGVRFFFCGQQCSADKRLDHVKVLAIFSLCDDGLSCTWTTG